LFAALPCVFVHVAEHPETLEIVCAVDPVRMLSTRSVLPVVTAVIVPEQVGAPEQVFGFNCVGVLTVTNAMEDESTRLIPGPGKPRL
jgi:hypothetical protein